MNHKQISTKSMSMYTDLHIHDSHPCVPTVTLMCILVGPGWKRASGGTSMPVGQRWEREEQLS